MKDNAPDARHGHVAVDRGHVVVIAARLGAIERQHRENRRLQVQNGSREAPAEFGGIGAFGHRIVDRAVVVERLVKDG